MAESQYQGIGIRTLLDATHSRWMSRLPSDIAENVPFINAHSIGHGCAGWLLFGKSERLNDLLRNLSLGDGDSLTDGALQIVIRLIAKASQAV